MSDKKFRILLPVKHGSSEILKEVLGEEFEVIEKSLTQDQLAGEIKKDYDAVIVSHWVDVSDDMISSASPRIKVIATLSVGFDHIDINAAEKRGIKILNATADNTCASAYAVAEHAFGLLLNIVRKICWCNNAVKKADPSWRILTRGTDRRVKGKELFSSTLGVIGVGRIGSHVARIGKGFHMKVLGYDPYVDKERVLEDGAELMGDFKEFLSKSDFISINPCLTDETDGMIDEPTINSMKDGVYIVNTARGTIVDENAIIEGLRRGKIAGYATDVLTGEPPTEETSHLLAAFKRGEFPNLLITPHIAWVTTKAVERYGLIIGKKVKESLTQL